MKQNYSWF